MGWRRIKRKSEALQIPVIVERKTPRQFRKMEEARKQRRKKSVTFVVVHRARDGKAMVIFNGLPNTDVSPFVMSCQLGYC